jgi:hypothetical protein
MARKGTGKGGNKRATKKAATSAPAVPATPDVTGGEQVGGKEATQFKPGQSGNPAGRPKGARSRLAESFISALASDFQANGIDAIKKVRQEEPAQYLRVVSSLVPKAFDLGEDEDGEKIAGVALITRGAIEAIIERGRSDG